MPKRDSRPDYAAILDGLADEEGPLDVRGLARLVCVVEPKELAEWIQVDEARRRLYNAVVAGPASVSLAIVSEAYEALDDDTEALAVSYIDVFLYEPLYDLYGDGLRQPLERLDERLRERGFLPP